MTKSSGMLVLLSISALLAGAITPGLAASSERNKELLSIRQQAMKAMKAKNPVLAVELLRPISELPLKDRISDWIVLDSQMTLVDAYVMEGKTDLAYATLKNSLNTCSRRFGADSPRSIVILMKRMDLSQSLEIKREEIEEDCKHIIKIMEGFLSPTNGCFTGPLQRLGAYSSYTKRDLKVVERIYAIRSKSIGFMGNQNSSGVCLAYAYCLLLNGRAKDAEAPALTGVKCAEHVFGAYSGYNTKANIVLALVQEKEGKTAEAARTWDKIWMYCEKTAPHDLRDIGELAHAVDLLREMKKNVEERRLTVTLDELAKRLPDLHHPWVLNFGQGMGPRAARIGLPKLAMKYFDMGREAAQFNGNMSKESLVSYCLYCASVMENNGFKNEARKYFKDAELASEKCKPLSSDMISSLNSMKEKLK